MKLKLILVLLFICLSVASVQAQVTMGVDEAPSPGMLLQLKTKIRKNLEDFDNPNASQGLLLPRVRLTSLTIDSGTDLSSTVDGGSAITGWDQDDHVGLVVFHIKKEATDPKTGVYVWNYDKAKTPSYEWLPVSLTKLND
ncbi:hypothetical protein [Dysgonomonas sp. 511]|uniref:hypothetical protein n=1 Tax=Dysgonomonas sp. 511 TaxID=2302930 RepID=UPI0013D43828|nr:hypothetical protein [Dysgonomonas sp. 511]NDV78775.1 hypothetical protein [Dysgonomonas sp. 511]